MKIAIVGAGIAGTTAAFWLHRSGFDVTVFEAAPELRDGGYIVDFWGVGYEVAEKMGLTAQVHAAGYDVEQLRLVDQNGGRVGGFNTRALRRMADGRFTSVARGDLARMIFNSVEGQVSTRFGSRVVDIEQSEVGVKVRPRSGRPQSFDLVIGADGTHSAVRRAVFGPDDRFETDLGYQVAAFEVPGYRPRDELVYLAHSSPGRMISRFAMRGDRTMFLTVFTDDRLPGPAPRTIDGIKHALWHVLGTAGWECPQILAALERTEDIYFDHMSQIIMDRWSNGRVALIGDAASAVSLLAGEGTGLAMAQAYVLAGELNRADTDYRRAFARQERLLRGFIEGKQAAARRFAAVFAPTTPMGVWARNQATKLLALPWLGQRIWRREISDALVLPQYGM
ncbi:FAD-binding domain [Mycolicibacterium mucogenicum]|jgi:2-polyprenyl-6-methoxyphenol hydroxylase-like FAD-dependent oxidoreductase|uniref:FAD-binding domain n=2 Tax=Mycobacteriaceae TaxID=1762 RepID=A0A4R5WD64_MYCMU|nr:FAD-binding domain [Mycolicibacterium mucogenicum]TDK87700.1 FAD-binding domain [Mycolicibacterium mucogenicum]